MSTAEEPVRKSRKRKRPNYQFAWKSIFKVKGPLREVAFCPFGEYTNLFATAGKNIISIFDSSEEGAIEPIYFSSDEAADEEFFALGWCTWDERLFVVAGGHFGLIKVIELTSEDSLNAVIEGHGDQINEIHTHPFMYNIIVTGSKDMSARVWDVKTKNCLLIFNRHVSNVLTVNWNLGGNLLVSGSMDNSIAIWDLSDLEELIDNQERNKKGPTVKASPKYITKYLHRNYVDSAAWLGDWILSKSIDNHITLWKPHFYETTRPPKKLHNFRYEGGDVWFLRFGLSLHGEFLGVGNMHGGIYVWDLNNGSLKPMLLQGPQCTEAVRRVAFNHNATTCLGVCDDGTCWRWDRITVENKKE